jgi:hypothetical protein
MGLTPAREVVRRGIRDRPRRDRARRRNRSRLLEQRLPAGDRPHAAPCIGVVGDQREAAAQLDYGGQLAVPLECGSDGFGSSVVYGEHRRSMGADVQGEQASPARAQVTAVLPPTLATASSAALMATSSDAAAPYRTSLCELQTVQSQPPPGNRSTLTQRRMGSAGPICSLFRQASFARNPPPQSAEMRRCIRASGQRSDCRRDPRLSAHSNGGIPVRERAP